MALLSTDRFWDRVSSGSPMFSDGAMGSELIGQGINAEDVLRTNLLDERIVRSIHDAYISAGAQFITSNTFGCRGGSDWYSECLAGANIALNAAIAASDEIGVWLSFPPLVVADETNALRDLFDSASIRPSMLLIETCTTLELACEAIRSARLIGPEVLAVTAHFGANGTLPDSATAEEWVEALPKGGTLYFCRATQQSYLRLLTVKEWMKEDVCTNSEALDAYARLLSDSRIQFAEESRDLDQPGQRRSEGRCRRSEAERSRRHLGPCSSRTSGMRPASPAGSRPGHHRRARRARA